MTEITKKAIEAAEREFTEYFVRNYPGPDTIIFDPKWHAPKLFRAATHSLISSPGKDGGQEVEEVAAEHVRGYCIDCETETMIVVETPYHQDGTALMKALEPFAEAAVIFEREYGDQMKPDTGCNIKFSALCEARSILSALKAKYPSSDRAASEGWQPIETAPKNQDILVWFDHEADTYQCPITPGRLTDYAAWAESGDFMAGNGFCIAKWFPPLWETEDEYGSGYELPAWWFAKQFGDYEYPVNPIYWRPLPAPPEIAEAKGSGQ